MSRCGSYRIAFISKRPFVLHSHLSFLTLLLLVTARLRLLITTSPLLVCFVSFYIVISFSFFLLLCISYCFTLSFSPHSVYYFPSQIPLPSFDLSTKIYQKSLSGCDGQVLDFGGWESARPKFSGSASPPLFLHRVPHLLSPQTPPHADTCTISQHPTNNHAIRLNQSILE